MANELSIHDAAGKTTVYFVVRLGGSFALAGGGGVEAYNASHWANYAVAAAEIGATGIYQASMPAGLSAGNYAVEAYDRLGGSPSAGDTWLGAGSLAWSGTAEIRLVNAGGKQAATLDWSADVTNKPTIGTSTFDPSSQTVKATDGSGAALATAAGQTSIASAAAAIKLKTDNLPASPAATGDVPTASLIANAVLSHNVSSVEAAAGRTSLTTLVLAATNKANTEDHAGFLTVYRTGGITEHARIPISINPTAAPIEGVG